MRVLEHALEYSADWRVTCFASSSARPRKSMLSRVLYGLLVVARFPFRLRKCDLVHINSTIDRRSLLRDWTLLVICRLCRRPVVVQFHGGRPLALDWVLRHILVQFDRAEAVLFLTQWQRDDAALLGLHHGQLVRNAVAEPVGVPLAAREPGVRYVCLSRLEEGKGLRELVMAFVGVEGDISLFVAGDGKLMPSLLEMAESDDRISILGWVDETEREKLLSQCDVLVMPSLCEAMPYAVLEALSYGLPVIISDAVEVSRRIADCNAGMVVRAGSVSAYAAAINAVAADQSSLVVLGANAKDLWRSEFSEDVLRTCFESIWNEAVA